MLKAIFNEAQVSAQFQLEKDFLAEFGVELTVHEAASDSYFKVTKNTKKKDGLPEFSLAYSSMLEVSAFAEGYRRAIDHGKKRANKS